MLLLLVTLQIVTTSAVYHVPSLIEPGFPQHNSKVVLQREPEADEIVEVSILRYMMTEARTLIHLSVSD